MEKQIHGGNIFDKDVMLDYSVNINPLGMPDGVREVIIQNIDKDETYPDIEYRRLKAAIASKEGVLKEEVLCGNGASELIMAVVRAEKPVNCAVAAPSFSGYERAIRAYGASIKYYELDSRNSFGYENVCSQLVKSDIQICFICNPNNPTGNIVPANIFGDILDICKRRNIRLVVDECFLRFHPDYENISCKRYLSQYDNLVVINAFTKFYAMAGIRLGYMMCHDGKFLDKVKCQMPEWNISSVAQRAGIEALKDIAYEEKTKKLISEERKYIALELKNEGCEVFPSETDYITFRLPPKSRECKLMEELLKRKILIRSCNSYYNMPSGCYRIAVKKHEDNECLIKNMREVLHCKSHDYT